MDELELRMYFFVPYNLSEIQKGIQAGHAALDYAVLHNDKEQFREFALNHKTWIILNGGTTNNCLARLGSLQQTHAQIIDWNVSNVGDLVELAAFYEPDLNDAMSAFCFICDQRVWDYKNYPDFKEYFIDIHGLDHYKNEKKRMKKAHVDETQFFNYDYPEWVKLLGGEKNVFLRELLKGKRLA